MDQTLTTPTCEDPAGHLPRIYLAAALLLGFLILGLVPPFQSPDEENHFLRAYQISTGQWLPERDETGEKLGGVLPASLTALHQRFNNIPFRPESKTSMDRTRRAWDTPLDPERTVFSPFPNTAVYVPVLYLPHSLGIAAARLAGLPPLAMLYAGRIAGLLAGVFAIWAALRIAPRFKAPLAAVALFPMVANQLSCITSDGMIIYASFLFFALCLRYAEQPREDRPRWPALGGLLASASILATGKQVYILLILCGLFIMLREAPRPRWRIQAIALVLACAALAFAGWSAATAKMWVPFDVIIPFGLGDDKWMDVSSIYPVDPARQLAFVLSSPILFLVIVLHSSSFALFGHVVGIFGWVDTPLPVLYQLTGPLVAAALLASSGTAQTPPRPYERILVLGLLAACVLGIYLGLYLIWSPVGWNVVLGMQGRYFLPLLPFGLWVFGSMVTPVVHQRRLPLIVLALWSGSTMWVVSWTLLHRYYVLSN